MKQNAAHCIQMRGFSLFNIIVITITAIIVIIVINNNDGGQWCTIGRFFRSYTFNIILFVQTILFCPLQTYNL